MTNKLKFAIWFQLLAGAAIWLLSPGGTAVGGWSQEGEPWDYYAYWLLLPLSSLIAGAIAGERATLLGVLIFAPQIAIFAVQFIAAGIARFGLTPAAFITGGSKFGPIGLLAFFWASPISIGPAWLGLLIHRLTRRMLAVRP